MGGERGSNQGLEKLGFPWILSSESRLFNGLQPIFGEKFFMPVSSPSGAARAAPRGRLAALSAPPDGTIFRRRRQGFSPSIRAGRSPVPKPSIMKPPPISGKIMSYFDPRIYGHDCGAPPSRQKPLDGLLRRFTPRNDGRRRGPWSKAIIASRRRSNPSPTSAVRIRADARPPIGKAAGDGLLRRFTPRNDGRWRGPFVQSRHCEPKAKQSIPLTMRGSHTGPSSLDLSPR